MSPQVTGYVSGPYVAAANLHSTVAACVEPELDRRPQPSVRGREPEQPTPLAVSHEHPDAACTDDEGGRRRAHADRRPAARPRDSGRDVHGAGGDADGDERAAPHRSLYEGPPPAGPR